MLFLGGVPRGTSWEPCDFFGDSEPSGRAQRAPRTAARWPRSTATAFVGVTTQVLAFGSEGAGRLVGPGWGDRGARGGTLVPGTLPRGHRLERPQLGSVSCSPASGNDCSREEQPSPRHRAERKGGPSGAARRGHWLRTRNHSSPPKRGHSMGQALGSPRRHEASGQPPAPGRPLLGHPVRRAVAVLPSCHTGPGGPLAAPRSVPQAPALTSPHPAF